MPLSESTNFNPFKEREHLPYPTNKSLDNLFVDVDKVVIKNDGVIGNSALSNEIVLTVSQTDHLQKLKDFLQIIESDEISICMCLGTYAIELCSNTKIQATIGFHHGVSIRYHTWNGDAKLSKSEELLEFLAELGLTKPLEDMTKTKNEAEARRLAEKKWLEIAPKCFEKHWRHLGSPEFNHISSLITDLNIEIPDKNKQIITLLETFGHTKNFWTGIPGYEIAPEFILRTISTEEIIQAYINSDRNNYSKLGLGRYLCSYYFTKYKKSELKYITTEVIDDLERCFKGFTDERGIKEIALLRNEK